MRPGGLAAITSFAVPHLRGADVVPENDDDNSEINQAQENMNSIVVRLFQALQCFSYTYSSKSILTNELYDIGKNTKSWRASSPGDKMFAATGAHCLLFERRSAQFASFSFTDSSVLLFLLRHFLHSKVITVFSLYTPLFEHSLRR